MESLADDVKSKILEGFPIRKLCQLKRVSKPLNTLIKSPDFTKLYDKLHLDQTDGIKLIVVEKYRLQTLNIDHENQPRPLPLGIRVDNTQLAGSSNGLICLYDRKKNSYSLLNPTTREFRVLPDPGTFRIPRIRLSGFGYVAQLDDFMVVSAAIDRCGMFSPVVKVYSAKSDSWEKMPARVGKDYSTYDFTSTVSVYLNGVAHWLGWTGLFKTRDSGDGETQIISWHKEIPKIMGFNFATKEFKLLSLNEHINARDMAFSVLDGCLCVLAPAADLTNWEMWVMEKYGDVESWTKTFSFRRTTQKSIFPICVAGNRVLFEINDELVLHDRDTNIIKKVKAGLFKIRESGGGVMQIARYKESLVSPAGYCQDERHIPNDVAEENEGGRGETVYETVQNVYGATQCPLMLEYLNRTYV